MGLEVRHNVRSAQHFVAQLGELQLSTGCVQTVLRAMGAPVHLHDVIENAERGVGLGNGPAYFAQYGLELNGMYELKKPVAISEMREHLVSPMVRLSAQDYEKYSGRKIVGLMLYFGSQKYHAPHTIGILPRNHMPRDIRRRLRRKDEHLVIDTSLAGEPVYFMTTRNIAENVNELVSNGVRVALSVVTRLARGSRRF